MFQYYFFSKICDCFTIIFTHFKNLKIIMNAHMVKEKKQAVKKHVCPEQGCPKSISGYTQSHNLKDHMRKKHNSI